jgi:hypothetical protein
MDPFSLKKKSAAKFIKNKAKKSSSRSKISPVRIVSLGILAEVNMLKNYDFTRALVNDLGLREEDVKLALVDPEADKTVEWEGYKVYGEDSFGMNARIKSGELENFVRREFDLLIDYTHTPWVFSSVVLWKSNAKLKAGFAKEQTDQTDISIEVPVNRLDDFHQELIRYLKIMEYV